MPVIRAVFMRFVPSNLYKVTILTSKHRLIKRCLEIPFIYNKIHEDKGCDKAIYRGLDRIQGMGSFCDFLRRPNGLGEARNGILLIAN